MVALLARRIGVARFHLSRGVTARRYFFFLHELTASSAVKPLPMSFWMQALSALSLDVVFPVAAAGAFAGPATAGVAAAGIDEGSFIAALGAEPSGAGTRTGAASVSSRIVPAGILLPYRA